ncbi:ABC transporter permease [Bradyrhizobium sp. dw_78]|uniref:ABC transporter permease n=1 Tax=Bradyrhizobium sp. dw_78 TaxID=2719793 RepID=UPI001BD1E563|nr:ABC transporter permease [Bradyrhizobium sp. dw_78]
MHRVSNIWYLGIKELRSLGHDAVLLGLVVFAFSYAIYSLATGISFELRNASVAIVDEDHSRLSNDIVAALLSPQFKTPEQIAFNDIDRRLDSGRDTFILNIPPKFQADVSAGRSPTVQVNADATAILQAGIGAGYIEQIVTDEVNKFYYGTDTQPDPPVALRLHITFNENLESSWFMGVAWLINIVTMLAIVLSGAAVIREREHGTLDHLLVMPLSPFEIAMAKVWANGLVIMIAAGLSLMIIVRGVLGLPAAGSLMLFQMSVMLYLFFATAMGILLGTVARSMPQFGLLFILVVLPMVLLSGGYTPLESMPRLLQIVMQAVPSTHFVKIAQAILFRGAGLDIIWPNLAVIVGVGGLLFVLALSRFRASISQAAG